MLARSGPVAGATPPVCSMTCATPHEPHKPKRSRLGATLRALIRSRITAGVITILPLLVTLWVVKLIFVWMRDASAWLVKAFLLSPLGEPYLRGLKFDFARWAELQTLPLPPSPQQFFKLVPWYWQWGVGVLSVLLTIFFLYFVGLFAANIFGRRFIETMEQLLDRVPLIKTVYRGLKQILGSFAGDQTQSFQRVALVAFPDQRMRAVGFITNVFPDSLTGEELCSVFIATTPNPTTGYLQIVKRADITELDWSVEEAIRTVMSAGILKPAYLTIVPNRDLPALQCKLTPPNNPASPGPSEARGPSPP